MATGRYPIPYGETVEQWSDEASGKGATHKRERNWGGENWSILVWPFCSTVVFWWH
jgi:hypothetical protein